MTQYRLHRYLCSSRPVIPLMVTLSFLGMMYSIKPMNVCSGYVISGVYHFILMTFVSLNICGNEELVEEQLLFFHGNGWRAYSVSRELSLLCISLIYGTLLVMETVAVNIVNDFSFYSRPLTGYDVLMGTMVILGSGIAGVAIGDLLHPRIVKNRKLAVSIVVVLMLCSIIKEPMMENIPVFAPFGFLLPSIMKCAKDLGNTDFFATKSVIIFFVMMFLYYLIVSVIKNIVLAYKKFS